MPPQRKRRRGRGEGAVFFSESKGVWVGRAVVGERPNGGPKYREFEVDDEPGFFGATIPSASSWGDSRAVKGARL